MKIFKTQQEFYKKMGQRAEKENIGQGVNKSRISGSDIFPAHS